MTTINGSQAQPVPSLLARWVAVERHEIAALLASFAMFFALLAAYYIVRPLRDEMGVSYGKGELHHLFTIVFFVMLVERGKEDAFEHYVRQEPLKIVAWLDSEEALVALEKAVDRT